MTEAVNAFQNGQNHILLGWQLGYKMNTVRNIIHRYYITQTLTKGPKGEYKSKNSAMTKEGLIDANPFLILKDMMKIVKYFDGTQCCEDTISNAF